MSDVSKVVCRSPLDLFLFLVSFFHPFESSPPRPPRLRSVDIIRDSIFFHVFSQSVGIREFAEGICSKYAGAQTSEPNVFLILSVTSLEGLSSPSPFFAAPFLPWELM